MKKPTAKIFLICWLGLCIGLPSIAFGYGGGGGGGEGNDLFDSMGPSASGGVSWAPNPNGADVMGSSVWDGRPESIQHGPYQPDKAVEDAEAELLSGFQSGNYTAGQVKEQLEWAQRVGIKLSPQAVKTLQDINNPPAPPKTQENPSIKPAKPTSKPSTLSSLASKWLKKNKKRDFKADIRTVSEFLDDQNKGKKSTKTTVGISYAKNRLKSLSEEHLPLDDASKVNDTLDKIADWAKNLFEE